MGQVAKKHETKDYVGLCVVCTKGVGRNELVYKEKRIFHPICFEQHGNDFPNVNAEQSQISARTKIELVNLRNLKVRTEGKNPSSSNPSRKKSTRRKTKRRTKRKTRRKPTRRRPSRRTKSRTKRRTQRKKTGRRR